MEFDVVEWYTELRKAREVIHCENSHLLSNCCVSGVNLISLLSYFIFPQEQFIDENTDSSSWYIQEETFEIDLANSRCALYIYVCVFYITWLLGVASDKRCRLFSYRLE